MKIDLEIYEPHAGLNKIDVDTGLKAGDFAKQFLLKHNKMENFPRPVFLHFVLEGGYGPLAALSQSLKATSQERAGLKNVLLERMKFIDKTLDLGKLNAYPTLPCGWTYIESSEKSFWSFCIGMVGARFGAAKLLLSKKLTLKRFLHKSLYCNRSLVFPGQLIGTIPASFGAKGNETVPDFLATDSNNRWHVFEAKGTGGTAFWSVGRDGLAQALNCAAVGYIGAGSFTPALTPPSSYSAIVTSITSEFASIHIIDPERNENATSGFSLALDRQITNLWEASLLADLIDGFKSEGNYWSEKGEQFSGYKIPELKLKVCIPTILLSEVQTLRTNRQRIIEVTDLLRLFTLDYESSSDKQRESALKKLKDVNLWRQNHLGISGCLIIKSELLSQISAGSDAKRYRAANRIFRRCKAYVMSDKSDENLLTVAQIVRKAQHVVQAALDKSSALDNSNDETLKKASFISYNGLCISELQSPDSFKKFII